MTRPLPNARSASRPSLPLASSTRWIHWTAVMHDSTKDAPTAVMPISDPCFGIFLPKNRIRKNDTTGMAGMIHA